MRVTPAGFTRAVDFPYRILLWTLQQYGVTLEPGLQTLDYDDVTTITVLVLQTELLPCLKAPNMFMGSYLSGTIAFNDEGLIFAASHRHGPSYATAHDVAPWTGKVTVRAHSAPPLPLGQDIWMGLALRAPALFSAFLSLVHDKQQLLPSMLTIIAAHVTGQARVVAVMGLPGAGKTYLAALFALSC